MRVKPGMSLYMIADLSNIWVMADIYEYELPWVKLGQKVEMNLSYFPGKKFVGRVTYIDPFLDAKTRTNKVRMEFANPNWKLKPDMYANVIIKSTIAKRGVAVPEEAVIHSGEREIVIVQNPSGTFESRELTLGPQAGGYYQVLKGLRAGETVVTSSNFLIDSESNLEEALSKLQTDKKGKSPKAPARNKTMSMSKMGSKKMQKKVPGIVEILPDKSENAHGNP
jgi:membrane fusion protein, copper/silver efflux system